MRRAPISSARSAARLGSAAVWLHQGLWAKVLQRDASHQEIVASVPLVGSRHAATATAVLGLGETALAGVVALAGNRRWVAGLQTAVLAAFNIGGLAVGRRHIPHPARLLARNAAFVAIIWSSVDVDHRH